LTAGDFQDVGVAAGELVGVEVESEDPG